MTSGVLDGPVARLRPLERRDRETVFGWYNDPELVAPFDRYAPESFDDFARSLEAAPSDPSSLAPRFAIEPRGGGDLAGVAGHYRAHPVLEYVDIWYVIGDPRARGRGLGSDAVSLLVDHLFRTETVERLGATSDVENTASYRLLEKVGFRREGTLRKALFHHGRWHDVYVYGISRSDPRPNRRPG